MNLERAIDQFISGPEGVAGSHELGRVLLSVDTPVSTRRAIRTDIANQTCVGIGSSQYRRRPWAGKYRQFRAALAHLARLPEGARNTSAFGGARRPAACIRFTDGPRPMRKFGKNAARFDSFVAGQIPEMRPFAIRYSLFAIRHSPATRRKADAAS